jgi:glycosyltransferase involved in cell wall biosynthesis
MPRADLDAMFYSPVVVLLPSRYDQFNLIALEALRCGAPTYVSETAGVSRWIKTRLPELSFLTFDLNGARAAANGVRGALADYEGVRGKIVNALSKRALKPDTTTLEGMYQRADQRATSAIETIRNIQLRFDSFNRPRERPEAAASHAPAQGLPAWKQAIINSPLRPVAEWVHHTRLKVRSALGSQAGAGNEGPWLDISDRSLRSLDQMQAAMDIEGTRSRMLRHGERTQEEIVSKLKVLSDEVPSKLVARDSLFREMMRLERKHRGGAIVAATYGMRLMRWAGEDRSRDLDFVSQTFEQQGFNAEAEAIRALYADPSAADRAVGDLLALQYEKQRCKELGEFAIHDDRRGDVKPKVTVIVSLYNAESKLLSFLRQLSAQSLVTQEDIEVVLVDSGSPTNEYTAFKAFMEEAPLPMLYVRTANRETIQAAWNRGIKLAKGQYLSFLGVDEGVHPDAYAILAAALDQQSDVDWVMADSIVTNVDKHGAFVSDVMTYDRRGYNQGLVYLETCYLSWVGGLYRRSIHDRFGYYDEAFRGAGDTEFKCRILPHIKSAHVPQTLGLFLNYPEERTTQHPRAEIEDLRAWYLYRTRAGVAYVWGSKPIAEVEDFFRTCLRYRKSYCGHWSTDFEMAHAVAQYMAVRGENAEFAAAALAITGDMLVRMRSLDAIDYRLSPDQRRLKVRGALEDAKREEENAVIAFKLEECPRFEIYNDNRYEQHWYSWSG